MLTEARNKVIVFLTAVAALVLVTFVLSVHAANTYSLMLDVSYAVGCDADTDELLGGSRERVRIPYRNVFYGRRIRDIKNEGFTVTD